MHIMRTSCALLVLMAIVAVGPLASHAEEGPQPKLPTISLKLGDKTLATEVADDDGEREKGMMFRKSMADGEAMLFVLDRPQHAAFWMRNTIIPLSVAYLNSTGMILEIYDLQPRDERPVGSNFDTIAYAIEVPQGWFGKNNILPGTIVKGLPVVKRQ
jgi:uncharacterized membrane protein (UPF0127 family)